MRPAYARSLPTQAILFKGPKPTVDAPITIITTGDKGLPGNDAVGDDAKTDPLGVVFPRDQVGRSNTPE